MKTTPKSIVSAVASVLLIAACGDDAKKPLGASCDSDTECESGMCVLAKCVDPDGDEDGDGLPNTVERALATDPTMSDSDGDGLDDGLEVGDVDAPTDTDGDGKPDVLEGAKSDADGDCVADQVDPADDDASVPGNACLLSCDGVLAEGETCDDGNLDPNDGCDQCAVVPTRVTLTDSPYRAAVANVEGGGFIMSWDESAPIGRSTVAFDADGEEIDRVSGENVGRSNTLYLKEMTPLRGGGAARATWRFETDSHLAYLEVRRYDDAGKPVGPLVEPYSSTNVSSYFAITPTAKGGFATVTVDGTTGTEYVVQLVDGDGTLGPIARHPLREAAPIAAAGLDDGSVMVGLREATAAGTSLVVRRYDANGREVAEVLAHNGPITSFALDYDKDLRWGVFVLEQAEGVSRIGYRMFEADKPLADMRYFTERDTEGCPTGIVGGFDDQGVPFAAVEDEQCKSPMRGWFGEGETFTLGDPKTSDNQYTLRASGHGTPVFCWADYTEGRTGNYVQRGMGKTQRYVHAKPPAP